MNTYEKYGASVRIPPSLSKRIEKLRQKLPKTDGTVMSRTEAVSVALSVGLEALELGGNHVQ